MSERMSAMPDGLLSQLAETRRAQGLTQRALAQRLDVPQSYLSTLESGKVDPRLSTVTELSRALEMEVVLVPRALVPAVRKILTAGTGEANSDSWLYRVKG